MLSKGYAAPGVGIQKPWLVAGQFQSTMDGEWEVE
jgi:hypothetical protein